MGWDGAGWAWQANEFCTVTWLQRQRIATLTEKTEVRRAVMCNLTPPRERSFKGLLEGQQLDLTMRVALVSCRQPPSVPAEFVFLMVSWLSTGHPIALNIACDAQHRRRRRIRTSSTIIRGASSSQSSGLTASGSGILACISRKAQQGKLKSDVLSTDGSHITSIASDIDRPKAQGKRAIDLVRPTCTVWFMYNYPPQ